ncbi:MAG TPA: hypothetical protein VMT12_11845 [Syntrophales bacterium]|nr:hypothetical protein [Syntrophales bacterium]
MNQAVYDKKHKRISVVFDTKLHARAIEILKNVAPYWRNDFISDAIVAYNNKRDDLGAMIEEGAKASEASRDAKFIDQAFFNL